MMDGKPRGTAPISAHKYAATHSLSKGPGFFLAKVNRVWICDVAAESGGSER